MIRHASLASGTPTALETNGTVREARGLASITYSSPECTAYCTFSSPTTPIASASSRVAERTCSSISSPSECGGKTHALSPECTPASSTCCMIPPIHTSAPSHSASTSTSVAFSRNRSRKMDGEEERERDSGEVREPSPGKPPESPSGDRKSTRLNSSHLGISYAVFCLKKK